ILFLQEPGEEGLCQVARVLVTVPLVSDKDIEWVPVSPTQAFHCRVRFRRTTVSSVHHDRPMCRLKNSCPLPRCLARLFSRDHVAMISTIRLKENTFHWSGNKQKNNTDEGLIPFTRSKIRGFLRLVKNPKMHNVLPSRQRQSSTAWC